MPNSLYAAKKYTEPVKLLDLMARKVEFVCATGHMARDPELRTAANGMQVCRFSLAVSWGKRDDGQVTEWCTCVAFRETAELIAERFSKGSAISVIGKLAENKWTTNDGEEKVTAQIQVWEVSEPLYKRRDHPPQQQSKPAGATTSNPGSHSGMPPAGGGGPSEEIPFMYSMI